ncbi:hypothetical protein HYFRA_00014049 [Hymenoscyphus fraxineus]|uniref:SP-RING-type domain-containing protein n=1 Tax=Hymenoscyphus fraxineus TaxID=746836 RepID=A0A9N9Q0F0_9HELO|nr:hypothetical protein HYFRA_00014049 [Hymenoscyphus fraxineus]
MRYPPDKNRNGNGVLSEQDVVSSNATLNTVFGKQRSWMTAGAGNGIRVHPTPRASTHAVPQTQTQTETQTQTQSSRSATATGTGILPSPAPSNEPSPILLNITTTNGRESHPQQPPQASREQMPPQSNNTPDQPIQIPDSPEGDTIYVESPQAQTTPSIHTTSQSPRLNEQRQTPFSLNSQTTATVESFLPRNPPFNTASSASRTSTAAGSRQPQARDNSNNPSTPQTSQRPTVPQINVPPQRSTAASSLPAFFQMSPGAGQEYLQRQLIAAQVHASVPAGQQEALVQRNRTQSIDLSSTSMGSPQLSHAIDSNFARPAKRQRTRAPMPSLKPKINMIDQQMRSLAQVPNSFLEYPRYGLLKEACENEDAFYVALHQIFCLWDLDKDHHRSQIVDIANFPSAGVLQVSFVYLGWLIRDNTALLADHKTWFANFPSPFNLLKTSEPYMRAVDNVGVFLSKLQTEWLPLSTEVESRKYPPLVDEMVSRIGLLSPTLQQVFFTASRRNLGFKEDVLGQHMETLFRRDREEHRNLSARYNTAHPPTFKEIEARNVKLKGEYIAAYQKLTAAATAASTAQFTAISASSAGSPVIQTSPNFPPGNGHPQPRMRSDNNQFHNTQQTAPYSQQMRLTSNPSPVASTLTLQGRNGSISGRQPHQNAPSPTMLQGLSMNSPVQQGFPPTLNGRGPMNQYSNQAAQQYATSQFPQQFQAQQMQLAQQITQQHGYQAQPAQQQFYHPSQPPRLSSNTQSIEMQRLQQQQQAYLQQQAMQQVINFNRTAEIRRESAPMINTQNNIRSRNSSVSTSGRQTPTRNTFSMGSSSPNVAMQPQFTQQKMLTQVKGIQNRYFVPGLGLRPQLTVTNPDHTSMHQSYLRSPVLRISTLSHLDKPQLEPCTRHYQVVRSLAFGPSKLDQDKPLTKFNFEISSEDLERIPKDHVYGSGKSTMRELEPGSLQYRLRCIQANPDVTACLPADWVVSDTCWPEGVFVAINKQQLELRRKFHHGKDLPIDVTQSFYADRHKKSHEITVSVPVWGPKTSTCFFGIEVIEIVQHNQIMEQCQKQRKSASQTLDVIKKVLAPQDDDDDDFAMVSSDLVIGLADPFMAQIFKIPVRGKSCKHHECFDLETFLITRVSKPKRPQQPCMPDVWKCPLCGKDARPSSLVVDDFLVSVREELDRQNKLDVKAIMVSPDGTWKAKEEQAPKRTATRDPFDDDPTDDEADGKNARAPSADATKKVPAKIIEIIELDDD